MPLGRGNKFALLAGQQKGSLKWDTKQFQDTLAKHNFNLAEAFLEVRSLASEEFKNGDPESRLMALSIMAKVTKDIADFSLPKLKAIEITPVNPLDGMSDAEKLAAMKRAIEILEKKAIVAEYKQDLLVSSLKKDGE